MTEANSATTDPYSVHGRSPKITETFQLLVIGAGPAGISAAIAAARAGASVLLVDENPVPPVLMAMDVPLHFGSRMAPVVRNRSAMEEEMLRWQPLLGDAIEAGVDVRLGTAAWGVYANAPDVAWLSKPTIGLVENGRSWLISADQVIVAAGRRDAAIAFAGWDAPGVMGLDAAVHLVSRYNALDARRVVIAGTGATALANCLALLRAGVSIAAIVEVTDEPVGPRYLVEEIRSAGVEIVAGSTLDGVESSTDGVTAVRIHSLDAARNVRTIECDAVLLGVRSVPVVDLLAAAGCRMTFDSARGGHVPMIDGAFRTTVVGVFAVGDCAGLWPRKSLDSGIAALEGQIAATAALAAIGIATDAPRQSAPFPVPDFDMAAYWARWIKATIVESDCDPIVCQCESVTASDLLELRPPRYLACDDADRKYGRALSDLAPPNPDQVKRLTRAGMGLCQGRRCREQTAALLAGASGVAADQIPMATYRAPVRPIPLATLGEQDESATMKAPWDSWFGMPTQFQPFWENEPLYRAADRDIGDGERGGE